MVKNYFKILDGCRYFFINEYHLKRILILCYGIYQAKSVNISNIDKEISSEISNCKSSLNINGWCTFQTSDIDPIIRQMFTLVVGLFYRGDSQVQILIDRTNWDIGRRKINILSIGLLHNNQIYIPLLHEDLGYKGNSDSETRINLIKKMVEWWTYLGIPLPVFEIIGDREFIGENWLLSLEELGIQYVIRLKSDLRFYEWLNDSSFSSYKRKVKDIMSPLHEKGINKASIVVGDKAVAHIVSVINEGQDSDKEKYIYLITNREDIAASGSIYRKRWKIETCFKHLKSSGFNLEDVNLEAPHKTDILMSILCLVYAMVIFLAEEEKKSQIKMQTYKNGKTYRRKSLFMIGKSVIVKLKKWDDFMKCVLSIIDKSITNLNKLKCNHILKQTG